MEFPSPILQGDNGLEEIRAFLRIVREREWKADNRCGVHIHLDMSDETSEECLNTAYAYRLLYPLILKFVSAQRGGNSMCGSPQYTCADIEGFEHFEDFVEHRDRFEFLNWRAYIVHKTCEIRLYTGTLKARPLCNWIKLHTRLIDRVKGMDYVELSRRFEGGIQEQWRALCELIGDDKLMDYWRRIAKRCGNVLGDEAATEEAAPVITAAATPTGCMESPTFSSVRDDRNYRATASGVAGHHVTIEFTGPAPDAPMPLPALDAHGVPTAAGRELEEVPGPTPPTPTSRPCRGWFEAPDNELAESAMTEAIEAYTRNMIARNSWIGRSVADLEGCDE